MSYPAFVTSVLQIKKVVEKQYDFFFHQKNTAYLKMHNKAHKFLLTVFDILTVYHFKCDSNLIIHNRLTQLTKRLYCVLHFLVPL